ncbi:hypothetical protein M514_05415 [Trichuris suis]|uniref:Uncharacterized protein n=1 Tax=Trichuris suis TaxID=68888 RepID=A0A085M914_9BILA|nr:hypothetical protein M513_05415 [Trichuris suis]KFD72425.1 hypothetical protein M514_05415 [Trichuris suis]
MHFNSVKLNRCDDLLIVCRLLRPRAVFIVTADGCLLSNAFALNKTKLSVLSEKRVKSHSASFQRTVDFSELNGLH